MIKIKEFNKSAKNWKDQTRLLKVEKIFYKRMILFLRLGQIKLHLRDIFQKKKEKKHKDND